MKKNILKNIMEKFIKTGMVDNIMINTETVDDRDELKDLCEKGYITINKEINENNIFFGGENFAKFKISICDSLINKIIDENLKRKKSVNNHDLILYSFMKMISEEGNVCFSDFELGYKRPDIISVSSFEDMDELHPVIYEIKHSHSDFMSDIRSPEKRSTYIKYSEKFFYVCPEGVIKKEEIPNGCGLIYVDNESYRIMVHPNEKTVNDADKVSILLTLFLRSSINDGKMQIKRNDKPLFDVIKNVEKYTARVESESIIFSSYHRDALRIIKEKIRHLSPQYSPMLLDLLSVGAIIGNGKSWGITKKGLQIIDVYDTEMKNDKVGINDHTIKFKGENIDKNIEFITVEPTKKINNIVFRSYFKSIEKATTSTFPSHYKFLISDQMNEELNKEIGIVNISKDGILLENIKKSKKIKLDDQAIIDAILLLIQQKIKNNGKYIILK